MEEYPDELRLDSEVVLLPHTAAAAAAAAAAGWRPAAGCCPGPPAPKMLKGLR